MRFYVPKVGDRITLTSDWNFVLHAEHRNKSLIELLAPVLAVSLRSYSANSVRSERVMLPSSTELEIDRVYVRATSKSATGAADDFDSITFSIVRDNKRAERFWVKLEDANKIEYEISSQLRDRSKSARAKKLTPQSVIRAICDAALTRDTSNSYVKPWITTEFVSTITTHARTYRLRWGDAPNLRAILWDFFAYSDEIVKIKREKSGVLHRTWTNNKYQGLSVTVTTDATGTQITDVVAKQE